MDQKRMKQYLVLTKPDIPEILVQALDPATSYASALYYYNDAGEPSHAFLTMSILEDIITEYAFAEMDDVDKRIEFAVEALEAARQMLEVDGEVYDAILYWI